jgi:hypothetical protein
MIPKGGNRFSAKDHAQTKSWSGMMIRGKIIPLQPISPGPQRPTFGHIRPYRRQIRKREG